MRRVAVILAVSFVVMGGVPAGAAATARLRPVGGRSPVDIAVVTPRPWGVVASGDDVVVDLKSPSDVGIVYVEVDRYVGGGYYALIDRRRWDTSTELSWDLGSR